MSLTGWLHALTRRPRPCCAKTSPPAGDEAVVRFSGFAGQAEAAPNRKRQDLAVFEAHVGDLFLDAYEYYRRYPDVAAGAETARAHFVRAGEAEGRLGSDAFDPQAYLRAYPDVRVFAPGALSHWLQFGSAEPLRIDPLPEHRRLPPGDRLAEVLQPPLAEGSPLLPAQLWWLDLRATARAVTRSAPAWRGSDPLADGERWTARTSEATLMPSLGERVWLSQSGFDPPTPPLLLVPPLARTAAVASMPGGEISLELLVQVRREDDNFGRLARSVEIALSFERRIHTRLRVLVDSDAEAKRRRGQLPAALRRWTIFQVGVAPVVSGAWVVPLRSDDVLLGEALIVLRFYLCLQPVRCFAFPVVSVDSDGRVLRCGVFERPPYETLGLCAPDALLCIHPTLLANGLNLFSSSEVLCAVADEDVCAPAEVLVLRRAVKRNGPEPDALVAVKQTLDRRFGVTAVHEAPTTAPLTCLIVGAFEDPKGAARTRDAVDALGLRASAMSHDQAPRTPPRGPVMLLRAGDLPLPAVSGLIEALGAGAHAAMGRFVVRDGDGVLHRGLEIEPFSLGLAPIAACVFSGASLSAKWPQVLIALGKGAGRSVDIPEWTPDRWSFVDACVIELPEASSAPIVPTSPLPIAPSRLNLPQTLAARLPAERLTALRNALVACD